MIGKITKLPRFPIARIATIVQRGEHAGTVRMNCGAQFNPPTEQGFTVAIRHGERVAQHHIQDNIGKHVGNCLVCWESALAGRYDA